jgi:hypothetical protein
MEKDYLYMIQLLIKKEKKRRNFKGRKKKRRRKKRREERKKKRRKEGKKKKERKKGGKKEEGKKRKREKRKGNFKKWIPAIHTTKATVRYFTYHGGDKKKIKKKEIKKNFFKGKRSYLYSIFVTQKLRYTNIYKSPK